MSTAGPLLVERLEAGGRIALDRAPRCWILAAPENDGIDIAAGPDFEDYDQD